MGDDMNISTTTDSYWETTEPSSTTDDFITELFSSTSASVSANILRGAFTPDPLLSDNQTTKYFNPAEHSRTLNLYDVLIPAIGAFVILLNLLVVVSSGLILKKGQQPRSTYLFLGNVAMADLVTGIAVVFGQATPVHVREFYICALQIGMIVSSTLASVYSVGLIAVDRFLYILHGLQYQRWLHPTRVRILIGITWFIGLVIGFLPLMGWAGDTENGRICWFILLAPKYLILLTVLVGIVPLLVVIILYSVILYHALVKVMELRRLNTTSNNTVTTAQGLRISRTNRVAVAQTVSTDTSHSSEESGAEATATIRQRKNIFKKIFMKKPNNEIKPPSKWKAIKVVMFITLSFLVTWAPYFVASLIYAFCDDQQSSRCKTLRVLIASPLAILGFFNSLLNPIIYAWWHQGFRTFVMSKFGKKKVAPTNSSSSNSTKQTGGSNSSRKNSAQSNHEAGDIKMHNVDLTQP